MARRHLAHAGMRLIALGDNAQLLVQAPAPPPFPAINDLNLGARHGFKADLTVDFKAYSFAMSGLVKARAGLTRRLRRRNARKRPCVPAGACRYRRFRRRAAIA